MNPADKKRQCIADEIYKLVSNDQLPGNDAERAIERAIKDESYLDELRKRPSEPPGAPPLNLPPMKGAACSIEPMQKIWTEFMLDSFYDPQVQIVLEKRHPETYNYAPGDSLGYPVFAWRQADSFVLGSNVDEDFIDLLRGSPDMEWVCELIRAVKNFYTPKPPAEQATIEKFMAWRKRWMLDETSQLHPAGPPGKWSEIALSIFGPKDKAGDGRLKKALHDENQRREAIDERWQIAWAAYFTGLNGWKLSPDVLRQFLESNKIALPE